MHSFLNIFFLIVFAATIKAQTHHDGQCPNSTEFVQEKFDPVKFAGTWYEIKTTLRLDPWEAIQKCVVLNFSKPREGVVQIVKTMVDKVLHQKTYDELTFIPQAPGSYDVEGGWHYAVVYTDYENFAILGACKDVFGDFLGHMGKTAVLARKKNLSADEKTQMNDIIENARVNVDNLQETIQDCA